MRSARADPFPEADRSAAGDPTASSIDRCDHPNPCVAAERETCVVRGVVEKIALSESTRGRPMTWYEFLLFVHIDCSRDLRSAVRSHGAVRWARRLCFGERMFVPAIAPLAKRIPVVGPTTPAGQSLIQRLFTILRIDLVYMYRDRLRDGGEAHRRRRLDDRDRRGRARRADRRLPGAPARDRALTHGRRRPTDPARVRLATAPRAPPRAPRDASRRRSGARACRRRPARADR